MLILWLWIVSIHAGLVAVRCGDPNSISTAENTHGQSGNDPAHHQHSHFSHEHIVSQAGTSHIHPHTSCSEKNDCSSMDRERGPVEVYKQPAVPTDHKRLVAAKKLVSFSEKSMILGVGTASQTSGHEGLFNEWLVDDKKGYMDSTESITEYHSNNQQTLIQDESADDMYKHSELDEDHDEWATNEAEDTRSAVRILRRGGDFEEFIEKGPIVIVYFYKDGGSEALTRFLPEYSKSAQHLLQYNVLLATVDCAVYKVASYCTPDKVNRYAYGFRDGQEKIAFPLDTLFNNNAIVASALHLALISAVPILQTAGERRDLEARCRGRCDIIFSFLHTLGTFEHRMFLEVAYAHQDKFVFAITTYTAGTLGLANPHPNDERENILWVMHCSDKTTDEDCVVSHYRSKMILSQLLVFIHALQLPIWHELAVSPTSSEVVTPYDGTGLPWVLLLYDASSRSRVQSLAPHLAQLLHGSVATITVNLEAVSDAALTKLGLIRHTITTPAIAFLQSGQESASLLNDYDDALEWVNEQLTAMLHQVPLTKEEQGYLPVQALEELQQDDEVVLAMVKEDSFTNIPSLAGPEPYASALNVNTLSVIVFYLAWDPVSNALMQHMNAVAHKLRNYGSQASMHRINCFDWPYLCDSLGITTYPVLRLHPKGRRNITYDGPIHRDYILKTILLTERSTPTELTNSKELEQMLTLSEDIHPACKVTSSAAVGIFSSVKDATAFTEASRVLEGSHLLGQHILPHAVDTWCETKRGCVVVSKPGDKFQPRKILNKEVEKSGVIINFIQHASLPVMAPLDPERYSALQVGVSDNDELPHADEHSQADEQHLIILFLPSNYSLSVLREKSADAWRYSSEQVQGGRNQLNKNEDDDHSKNPDDMWSIVGQLAAELSKPGFIFSWLLCDDPLADDLLPVYGLSPGVKSLVAVNQRKHTVNIFTKREATKATIKDWLKRLRGGHLQPSIELPKQEWVPRLPGFDYLKFMLEDQDRDAEDHLILEMEADLSAHHQGDSSENKKHPHEEL
nr:uncharacterized protein LOC123755401 [Procambarus clarkii]